MLPGQPQEGLLEVVVGFGRDVVVLQVLLPVEHDCLRLQLPILDINLQKKQIIRLKGNSKILTKLDLDESRLRNK